MSDTRDGKDLSSVYTKDPGAVNTRIQGGVSEITDLYPSATASATMVSILGQNSWCRLFFGGFEKPPVSAGREYESLGISGLNDIDVKIYFRDELLDNDKIFLRVDRWRGWYVVIFNSSGLERGMYRIEVTGIVRGKVGKLVDHLHIEPISIESYLISRCRQKLYDKISGWDRHIDLFGELIRWDDTLIYDEINDALNTIRLFKAEPGQRTYTLQNLSESLVTPLIHIAIGNLLSDRQIKEIDEAHTASTDFQVDYSRDYTALGEQFYQKGIDILERSLKFIRPWGDAAGGHKLRFMLYPALMSAMPFTRSLWAF